MFFLPAAIFAHAGDIGWGDALRNWVFAFLGNLVGASVFVAGAYHYLYGRVDRSALDEPGDTPGVAAGNGRTGPAVAAGRPAQR
jgi:glycerol uptake facilitator-like aquaporin